MNIKKNLPLISVCVVLMLLLCAVCSCSIFNDINEAGSQVITAASKGPGDDYGTGGPRPVIVTETQTDEAESGKEYYTRIEYVTGEWGEFITDDKGEEITEVITYEPETVIEIVTTPAGDPETDEKGEVETKIIVIEPETTPQQGYSAMLKDVNHFAEGIEYKYITESGSKSATKLLASMTAPTEFPIGGWMTPVSALRTEVCGKNGALFAAYKRLDWAGFNFVITQDEWSSTEWLLESVAAARLAKLKVWYNCGNQDADYSIAKIHSILDSEYADALTTVIVNSALSEDQLEDLGETSKVIRRELGEDSKLKVFSILQPPYAASAFSSKYPEFIRSYILGCKPHALMYDYCPYQGKSALPLPEMVATLMAGRAQALANGMPMYGVVQCSGSDSLREPSLYEIRLNAHLNLALGADGLVYYMAAEQEYGSATAMLDKHGMATDVYNKVAAVNEEILALKGRCIDFVCDGVIIANSTEVQDAVKTAGQQGDRTSYRHLASVTEKDGKAALVGLFRPTGNGFGEGYYVVNPDTENGITVTLTMDVGQALAVWGSNGCELFNWCDSITLTLGPGEGLFIENSGADSL